MIKNYFKTAWRNLTSGKAYSLINVLGLSIGMGVALLLCMWIYDELSYNKTFAHYDRIARVTQNVTNNGEVQTWQNMPLPLADELRQHYGSDFDHIAMGTGWGDHRITAGDKKLKATAAFFEPEMPEMFTLHMVHGNRNALIDPTSVLVSTSAAKAFFGDENPVGKAVRIDSNTPLTVAGVYDDFPANSAFAKLDVVAPWAAWLHANNDFKDVDDPWRPNFVDLYVQIKENADFDAVSARIRNAKYNKVNEQLKQKKPALFLHPMSKWRLYGEFKNGLNTGGAIRYVRMFGLIGVFVLLLACINFMNLSTARSTNRAREVGIRKTIGSFRAQLIYQFFCESLVTVACAFMVALLLAWLLLPYFNQVALKSLQIAWGSGAFWGVCLSFVVFTAIVAGSYPAFYLSSFRPAKVLKGVYKAGKLAALPRKVLVALQFSISMSLLIGTVVIYRQIQFAKDRPVGYSRANLLTVATEGPVIHQQFDALSNELQDAGVIESMAESESPVTAIWNTTSGFSWPGKEPGNSTDFGVITASHDYGTTIGWQVVQGRGFSRNIGSDSAAVMLNEAAVHYMKLDHPVGTTVTWWGQKLTVIGVIRDMVVESPYTQVPPVIYPLLPAQGNMVVVRLNPHMGTAPAIAKLEAAFKRYAPGQPFEYKFVDQDYAGKFGNEERIGKLAGIFTLVAIVICCLGLFGLTAFVAEQRRKEMGVRKVLGASAWTVWRLLSKDFVVLGLIGFGMAVPLSYAFMSGWLQNYTYRTALSWWIFAAAGAGAILVTAITVSFQAVRAALVNPVKSLRTE